MASIQRSESITYYITDIKIDILDQFEKKTRVFVVTRATIKMETDEDGDVLIEDTIRGNCCTKSGKVDGRSKGSDPFPTYGTYRQEVLLELAKMTGDVKLISRVEQDLERYRARDAQDRAALLKDILK